MKKSDAQDFLEFVYGDGCGLNILGKIVLTPLILWISIIFFLCGTVFIKKKPHTQEEE